MTEEYFSPEPGSFDLETHVLIDRLIIEIVVREDVFEDVNGPEEGRATKGRAPEISPLLFRHTMWLTNSFSLYRGPDV